MTPEDRQHPPQTAPFEAPKSGRAPRMLIAIVAVALLMRVGWGALRLLRGGTATLLEFPDEQQYWLMAQSLWLGDGLADELGFRATRMPLYPGLLSIFTSFKQGVYIATALHWILGAAAAGLTACLANAMFGARTAIAAGLLVACDPFLVFFSSLLLSETLYITLSLAFWWSVWPMFGDEAARTSWRRRLLAGALAGACVYARESGLGLVGAALIVLLFRRRFAREALVSCACIAVTVGVMLLPWAIRNAQTIGQLSFLTQRGGISLYDGVGPQATGRSDLGNIKQMPAVRGLNEVEWNRYFIRESIGAMRRDPIRIVKLAGVKLARMWNPVPNVDAYQSTGVRTIAALWTIPTFALAAAGAVMCFMSRTDAFRAAAVMLLVPAVYLSLVHCFFVGSIRYRLGAIPMLHILTAAAIVAILHRLQTKPKPGVRKT